MKDTKAEQNFIALKDALAKDLDPNTVYDCHRAYSLDDRELRRLRPTATFLHWSFESSTLEAADCLLQHGADIDLCNLGQLTVLHEVILDENEEAVAFLLEKGADPDRRYPDGMHCLNIALAINNVPIFRLLVDAMPDLTTASTGGWTIVDLALLAGDHRALEIVSQKDRTLKPSPCNCSEPREVPEDWNTRSRAKQLLAFCTSKILVLPSELHEIYAHILLSLTGTHHAESDTIMPTLLIEDFFRALFDAACIKIPVSRVKLCQPCLSFQQSSSKFCNWFQVHQSRGELDECAQSCPLCRLVVEAFDNAEDVAKKEGEIIAKHRNGDCGGIARTCQFCLIGTSKKENDYVPLQGGTSTMPIRFVLRHGQSYPLEPEDRTCLIAEDIQKRLTVELPIDVIDEAYLVDPNTSVGLDISTGSPQSFDIAARWLDQCRRSSNHEDCQKAYPNKRSNLSPELPTRILDLSSFPNTRLVDTNGTRSAYCALSYCWGDATTNTTTTRGNVSKHRKGIPMESLPVFIQEALVAARTLGYRYIWIDALCIIQDDPDDWDKEASRMKDVYSNAELTLSSLAASGCHEHLFHSRGVRMTRPIPFDIWTPKDKRPRWKEEVVYQYAVYPSLSINNNGFYGADNDFMSIAPITTRGWAFQEQMLSTRILYFGSNHLFWECLCVATTDSDPSKVMMPWISGGIAEHTRRKYALQGLTHPRLELFSEDTRYQPYGIWQSLLTSYTERHLTKLSDRIPAFLAISKALESAIGDVFTAGVWKGERLLESLSWNVKEAADKHPQGPSWSWASMDQIIQFDCLKQGYSLAVSIPLATMVSFDVQTNYSQSHISGSIKLRGTLHKKEVKISSESNGVFFDYQEDIMDQCFALDLVVLDKEGTDEYVEDSDGYEVEEILPIVVVRLLLKPVDQTDSSERPCTFRRIGICRDKGDGDQVLEDALLPRKNSDAKGVWSGIVWSEGDRIITII
ncbi:heterokaryon incompatibility [Fusarium sporotrichioides]|uniref:Heterokaryon incompatibility n=1 Tax=Fusarium sporotrichioides TaxID=5514 RepID=A0A395SCG4_FUSSP|nr:heterokaryon incompatibility [Fusarium sporotrichioides]